MNWIPYGPDAWLLRFADRLGDDTFARGQAIATELERRPPDGLVEFVPSFTTVLLEFQPGSVRDPARELAALGRRLEKASVCPPKLPPIKEIPVIYDGPDLERVANTHNLTLADVVAKHSATVYKVYLIGFSPGFPYLGDLDPSLHTPRLSSPRARVAAGSVAIGGEHTGIYTIDSPGGWNIIGHTSIRLFDPERRGPPENNPERDAAMFWLKAGDRVRFIPRILDQ